MSHPEILTASRFYLELSLDGSNQSVDGIFMDCKGFKCSQEVIEVCEVTPNKWGRAEKGMVMRTKIPGNVKTNNIVLSRGMISSLTLWKWFEETQKGNWAKQRRDGSLKIYNQKGETQAQFQFLNGWATSYKISDLTASSADYEIEELEIACEVFKRVPINS
ncbi:MAG: phage tail protein [Xenococcaceae cyanobacterium]